MTTELKPGQIPVEELIGDHVVPLLHDAAATALNALRAGSWPVLLGPTGSGKTHVAGWLMRPSHPAYGRRRLYRWDTVLMDIRSSFGRRDVPSESQVLDAIAKREDLVVLDDIGAGQGREASDWAIGALAYVIHEREGWGRPTAITSNLSVEQLGRTIGDRSMSRLRSKAVFVQMPDFDLRLARRRDR